MSKETGPTFFIRKLHSLAGVVPVGVFVVFHLFVNSLSLRGPEVYNGLIATLRSIPFLMVIETVFIFIPILFHALYGLVILSQSDTSNLTRYGYARNWHFFLQRWTGVFAFIFILYHVITLRFGEYFGQPVPNFEVVGGYLINPFIFVFYILGVIATVYHLTNGLWLFGVNWGILISPRAQRVGSQAMGVLFLLISAMGISALLPFILH